MALRRCEVVRKRADRDLLKSLNRLHQVEGLLIAMNDMDKACSWLYTLNPKNIEASSGGLPH